MIKSQQQLGDKARRRRAAIIEAALVMFAERGYEGASIRDVSGLLGINEASLYYYFASKDALYSAVLGEHIFNFDFLEFSSSGPPAAWLQDLATSYLENLDAYRRVTSIVVAEAFKETQHPAVVAFEEQVNMRRNTLASLLVEAGQFDADWMANRFFSGLFGAWALEMHFGGRPWSKAQIEVFTKRFVRDLLQAAEPLKR